MLSTKTSLAMTRVISWDVFVLNIKSQVSFAEYSLFHRALLHLLRWLVRSLKTTRAPSLAVISTSYGVASVSRIDEIVRLFCHRSSWHTYAWVLIHVIHIKDSGSRRGVSWVRDTLWMTHFVTHIWTSLDSCHIYEELWKQRRCDMSSLHTDEWLSSLHMHV